MPLASTVLDRAAQTLGGFLPRLGGAIVLLVVGLIIVRLAATIVKKALEAADVDAVGTRIGIDRALRRVGISTSLAAVIARAIRIVGTVVVVVAAISLLGFETLTATLNAVLLFLPRALAAAALLIVGIVLAEWLRHHVDRGSERMDLAAPLGSLVEIAVIGIFAVTALSQLAVPLAILTVIVMILVAAAAFGLALAFGLGARELAREITAGRSLAGSLQVGQEISAGEIRGEIVGFESTATILQGPGDARLRVPNRLLADAVLTLHDPPRTAEEGGSTAR